MERSCAAGEDRVDQHLAAGRDYAATTKVGLKLNTPRSSLEDVLAVIGKFGEHAPTISPLIDDSWVALEIILDERQEREMIPELRRAGASGLVSYPLNKVIS